MNAYFMQNYGGYDYGFLYLCGSLAGYTLPYIYNLGNIIVLHSIMEHNDMIDVKWRTIKQRPPQIFKCYNVLHY